MHDTEFAHFATLYPASRRVTTPQARHAFAQALALVPFATLLAALEQHKKSTQWQRHVIPSLVTWLREKRWEQVLPEPEPARLSVADEARRLASLSPQEQLRRLGVKR